MSGDGNHPRGPRHKVTYILHSLLQYLEEEEGLCETDRQAFQAQYPYDEKLKNLVTLAGVDGARTGAVDYELRKKNLTPFVLISNDIVQELRRLFAGTADGATTEFPVRHMLCDESRCACLIAAGRIEESRRHVAMDEMDVAVQAALLGNLSEALDKSSQGALAEAVQQVKNQINTTTTGISKEDKAEFMQAVTAENKSLIEGRVEVAVVAEVDPVDGVKRYRLTTSEADALLVASVSLRTPVFSRLVLFDAMEKLAEKTDLLPWDHAEKYLILQLLVADPWVVFLCSNMGDANTLETALNQDADTFKDYQGRTSCIKAKNHTVGGVQVVIRVVNQAHCDRLIAKAAIRRNRVKGVSYKAEDAVDKTPNWDQANVVP